MAGVPRTSYDASFPASQKLKKAIEGICELNHELLRPDAAASKSRRKQHD